MEIFKKFTFDSAHFLPFVPEDHKCRRMHGHTDIVRLYIKGELDSKLGWVADFGDVNDLTRSPMERCVTRCDRCIIDITQFGDEFVWHALHNNWLYPVRSSSLHGLKVLESFSYHAM